jgi:hypothetical protein
LAAIIPAFTNDPALSAWYAEASVAVGNATAGNTDAVVRQQLIKLQSLDLTPQLLALIDNFSTKLITYRNDRDALLEMVAKGPLITVEYLNERRPGLIDTSNINFIAETGLFKGKADLTYNGSITLYNSKPIAPMRRVRDFDQSLRLDVPLGDVRKIGNFLLTFAGQYKRIQDDESTDTGTLYSPEGDIATGQLRLTIPIKGTGVKIPISLSFANRTELIKEREIRGNFGFTLDLDSIFANLKP